MTLSEFKELIGVGEKYEESFACPAPVGAIGWKASTGEWKHFCPKKRRITFPSREIQFDSNGIMHDKESVNYNADFQKIHIANGGNKAVAETTWRCVQPAIYEEVL